MNNYNVKTTTRTAAPRSKRLKELGVHSGTTSGSSVIPSGGGGQSTDSGNGHTHTNLEALEAIRIDELFYLWLSQKLEGEDESKLEKVKAGFADLAEKANTAIDAEKWSGKLFKDYLDQPVRKKDMVEFLEVVAKNFKTPGFSSGVKGSGAAITEEGTVEGDRIISRKSLQSIGPAIFNENLSSEEFVSGFLNGKGWAIIKKEILNALGVAETKYSAEFDEVVVRGVLRVFSFVVSQMLGENDNRVFTGMLEVDHYDPESGKVYLKTQDGKLYNPFREGDYIMVQQYNGLPSQDNDYYVTKHYELLITDAGMGNTEDGVDRLDWVTFSNFVSSNGLAAAEMITAGDTFVRVDNASDPDRKGIIQVMTVGPDTPYIDIIHGLKTDPDNALKGRLGNLKGIQHHLFGWLQGFGELLQNLYAVGDFRLRRTGESLDAKIEMLKGMFATAYQRISYDITEEDNYLKNATFTESMDGWESYSDISLLMQDGEPFLVNGGLVSTTGSYAKLSIYDGRNMLHLNNSYVQQDNSIIRKPGTHKEYLPTSAFALEDGYVEVKDTLYLTVKFLAKTSGILTIGFNGADSVPDPSFFYDQIPITSSYEWQTYQWSDTWSGIGNFILQYTGEMYVSLLSVTDRPIEEFRKTVSTKIEQTDSNIKLLGLNADNLKGTVTNLGIELDAAQEQISIYANKVSALEGTATELGIRLDAAESNITIYANKISEVDKKVTNLGIELDAAQESLLLYVNSEIDGVESSISELRIDIDGISSTVTSVQGDLAAAKATAAAASQAAQDRADAAYSTADSAAVAAANAQSTADAAWAKSLVNATAINQNADSISAIAGKFDSNGKLIEGSGWVTTSSFNSLYTLYEGLDSRMSTKAEVSTSVQYDPETGRVISDIKLSADNISLEGFTTINNSFQVYSDGTARIGGFVVSGNSLSNYGQDGEYITDANISFWNLETQCHAAIGGNVAPSTSVGTVAWFQNHKPAMESASLVDNHALLVSAQGAQHNIAINIGGGAVKGFAMKNTIIASNATSKILTRDDYNVIALNVNDCTVTLPTMYTYDDGHVIRIKKLGSGKLNIKMSGGYTWQSLKSTYSSQVLVYNSGSTTIGSITIENTGESCEFVWCRDISYTIDNTKYYGAWIQYKLPRNW